MSKRRNLNGILSLFMTLGGLGGFAWSMIHELHYQQVAGYSALGALGGFGLLFALALIGFFEE